MISSQYRFLMKGSILRLGKVVLMALALTVGFFSCEKKEDLSASQVEAKDYSTLVGSGSSSNAVQARASYSSFSESGPVVSDVYKNNYSSGYLYASSYHDQEFIKRNPIGVGFFAAYNAVNPDARMAAVNKTLSELCSDYYGTEFRSYSSNWEFKTAIEHFLSVKHKPVVVSIKTQQRLNDGTYRAGCVIIWASRDGKAVVTNTNFIPAQQFGDNAFHRIPYTELFQKAIGLSNYGVANVAYMDAFPDSL